jgi:hypothetical protein
MAPISGCQNLLPLLDEFRNWLNTKEVAGIKKAIESLKV